MYIIELLILDIENIEVMCIITNMLNSIRAFNNRNHLYQQPSPKMNGLLSSPTRGTTTTTDRTITEGTTIMVTGKMVIIMVTTGRMVTDSTGKMAMGSKGKIMVVLMEGTITKTMERY